MQDETTVIQRKNIVLSGTFAAIPASASQYTLYFATDTQELYYWTGAAWTQIAGIPPDLNVVVIRKTSDETIINNATLQNDDELTFPVAANEVWDIELFLKYATDGDGDIQYAFALPAAGVMYRIPDYLQNVVVNNSDMASATLALNVLSVDVTNAGYWAKFIYIGGANAGNIQLQWAQRVVDAHNTSVLTNSYLKGTVIL